MGEWRFLYTKRATKMWYRKKWSMATTTENPNIRISSRSKATLRELAKHEGRAMQTILDAAIENYRRDKFFQELDEDYSRLQGDSKAWQEELAERRLWETTIVDGLNRE